MVFLSCFWTVSVYAEENLLNHNEDVEGLYDDLEDGEVIVDFYTEDFPEDANEVIAPSIGFDPGNDEFGTLSSRTKKWYPTSKSYLGHYHGGWRYAGASTTSGGTLVASHTVKVSNTYTGSLTVSLSVLNSYLGFNTTRDFDRTVSYRTKSYPNGNYRLQYRHVYKNYRVKQDLKYSSNATKVYDTRYVYPKRWIERQYRVVRF